MRYQSTHTGGTALRPDPNGSFGARHGRRFASNWELEQAHAYLDRALEKQRRAGTPYEQARLLLRKAQAYARQKKYDTAKENVSEAVTLHGQDSPSGLLIQAEANAVSGLIHKERGDIREAITLYRRAGDMYAQAERHSAACDNLREAADLLFRSGDITQAFEVQGQALEIAQNLISNS